MQNMQNMQNMQDMQDMYNMQNMQILQPGPLFLPPTAAMAGGTQLFEGAYLTGGDMRVRQITQVFGG